MSWTCPKCQKTFAKTGQGHTCVKVSVDEIFEGKSPTVFSLYDKFLSQLEPGGTFRVTTSLKSITLYGACDRAFLILQPKRKWLDMYFFLNREILEFPIFKVNAMSQTRIAHYVRIQDEEDIDPILNKWIGEAYERVCGA